MKIRPAIYVTREFAYEWLLNHLISGRKAPTSRSALVHVFRTQAKHYGISGIDAAGFLDGLTGSEGEETQDSPEEILAAQILDQFAPDLT